MNAVNRPTILPEEVNHPGQSYFTKSPVQQTSRQIVEFPVVLTWDEVMAEEVPGMHASNRHHTDRTHGICSVYVPISDDLPVGVKPCTRSGGITMVGYLLLTWHHHRASAKDPLS